MGFCFFDGRRPGVNMTAFFVEHAQTIIVVAASLLSSALTGLVSFVLIGRQHRLQAKERKNAELRTKLEALVNACCEVETWRRSNERYWQEGDAHAEEPDPFPKIAAMATLYFPMLKEAVENLQTAEINYRVMLIERAVQEQKNPQTLSDDLAEQSMYSYREIRDAQTALNEAARTVLQAACALLDDF